MFFSPFHNTFKFSFYLFLIKPLEYQVPSRGFDLHLESVAHLHLDGSAYLHGDRLQLSLPGGVKVPVLPLLMMRVLVRVMEKKSWRKRMTYERLTGYDIMVKKWLAVIFTNMTMCTIDSGLRSNQGSYFMLVEIGFFLVLTSHVLPTYFPRRRTNEYRSVFVGSNTDRYSLVVW